MEPRCFQAQLPVQLQYLSLNWSCPCRQSQAEYDNNQRIENMQATDVYKQRMDVLMNEMVWRRAMWPNYKIQVPHEVPETWVNLLTHGASPAGAHRSRRWACLVGSVADEPQMPSKRLQPMLRRQDAVQVRTRAFKSDCDCRAANAHCLH